MQIAVLKAAAGIEKVLQLWRRTVPSESKGYVLQTLFCAAHNIPCSSMWMLTSQLEKWDLRIILAPIYIIRCSRRRRLNLSELPQRVKSDCLATTSCVGRSANAYIKIQKNHEITKSGSLPLVMGVSFRGITHY